MVYSLTGENQHQTVLPHSHSLKNMTEAGENPPMMVGVDSPRKVDRMEDGRHLLRVAITTMMEVVSVVVAMIITEVARMIRMAMLKKTRRRKKRS